jgi:DNA repair exonuclease SbcCD ATPase subunit
MGNFIPCMEEWDEENEAISVLQEQYRLMEIEKNITIQEQKNALDNLHVLIQETDIRKESLNKQNQETIHQLRTDIEAKDKTIQEQQKQFRQMEQEKDFLIRGSTIALQTLEKKHQQIETENRDLAKKLEEFNRRIESLNTYHIDILQSDINLPFLDNTVESTFIEAILSKVQNMLIDN